MKKIETIVQSHKINSIQQVLRDNGIYKFTLLSAQEMKNHNDYTLIYRGTRLDVNPYPMIKIEVIVPDDLVETVMTCIAEAVSWSGDVEDPMFFVSNGEQMIRPRTGRISKKAA